MKRYSRTDGSEDHMQTVDVSEEEIQRGYEEGRAAEDAARKWLDSATSWRAVNMREVLSGRNRTPGPSMFARSDGVRLLYPGKAHSFVGASESLKSWAAMLACAQVMADGGGVLYIDFEDNAETFVERMRVLGVTDDTMLAHLCYIRPDEPLLGAVQHEDLVAAGMSVDPALIVLDGVTECMAMHGWDPNAAVDVAKYHGKLLRKLTQVGAATLEIDHAGKDELRGAAGSQHKRAGIDGVVYTFKVVQYAARGVAGYTRISVSKDRHGHVRAHAKGNVIGDFHLDTSEGAENVAWVSPPADAAEEREEKEFDGLEALARIVESLSEPTSTNQVAGLYGKTPRTTQKMLGQLVHGGYVIAQPGSHNATLWSSVRLFPSSSSDSS